MRRLGVQQSEVAKYLLQCPQPSVGRLVLACATFASSEAMVGVAHALRCDHILHNVGPFAEQFGSDGVGGFDEGAASDRAFFVVGGWVGPHGRKFGGLIDTHLARGAWTRAAYQGVGATKSPGPWPVSGIGVRVQNLGG